MILVTGGTGYIGSHACVALAQAGHELLILDNLCNSRAGVVDRLQSLCGKRPGFVEGDIRDTTLLDNLFARHPISAVMHFAGLKAVGESVQKPLEYYDNNVHGRRKTCWRRLSGPPHLPRCSSIAKTHTGLISAFSLHLVKAGRVSVELGKTLNKAEELRLVADYKGNPVEKEDAAWAVSQAQIFVQAMQTTFL